MSQDLEEISTEDRRFSDFMDTETKKIGKHFQLPLLFKNFTLYLPNNRTVTEKCLTSFSPANISTSVQRCFQVDMTS